MISYDADADDVICRIVFCFLSSYPPFFDDQPYGIYEKILAGKIDWPKNVDPIARFVGVP